MKKILHIKRSFAAQAKSQCVSLIINMEAPLTSEQVKIYGNTKLTDRVNAFQKTVSDKQSQFSSGSTGPKINIKSRFGPSSQQHDTNQNQDARPKADTNNANYGRPVEGSKSDKRGKAAAMLIGNEIHQLCSIIKEYGKEIYDPEDPSNGPYYMITFKELFDIYTVISNKVVGCLLRARKHGLVDFEGEMLFQRRDDNVIITLIIDPSQVHADQDSTSCIKSQT